MRALACMAIALPLPAIALEPTKTLECAKVGDRSLKLDLYLPEGAKEAPPLLVYVHGGAWRRGSRANMPLGELVEKHSLAIASVDYRLSTEAVFPAQVHDIKAAIRFLRSQATELGYSGERIAIAGSSAGGHLAALVGVSNGNALLEGEVGEHLDQSSDIAAVVSFYGASNLTSILAQSTPHGLKVRVPALELLLGDRPENVPDLARLASPVTHVDAKDPALLLIHGDQDPQMPINQSHELMGKYEAVGAESKFIVAYGAAHGGSDFYTDEMDARVVQFLRHHIRLTSPD